MQPRPHQTPTSQAGNAILPLLIGLVAVCVCGIFLFLYFQSPDMNFDSEPGTSPIETSSTNPGRADEKPIVSSTSDEPSLAKLDQDATEETIPTETETPAEDLTCTVTGSVFEKDTNSPAVGARVEAVETKEALPHFALGQAPATASSLVSDHGNYSLSLGKGSYQIRVVSGGTRYLPLRLKDWTAVKLDEDEVRSGVNFTVTRGGRLYGTVLSAMGTPQAKATVRAVPADVKNGSFQPDLYLFMSQSTQVTDDEGWFEIFPVLFSQKTTLAVDSEEHANWVQEGLIVTEEEPDLEVRASLQRGSTIQGVARYEDGDIAPSVKVRCSYKKENLFSFNPYQGRDKNVTTDESGSFIIEHLAAGTYILSTGGTDPLAFFRGGDKGTEIEIDGKLDVAGVVLTAPRREEVLKDGVIQGLVTNRESEPLAGVKVTTSGGGSLPFARASQSESAETNEEGKFTLSGLVSTDSYTLTASLEGFETTKQKEVFANGTSITLILQSLGTISGSVVTEYGTPPEAGFQVRAVVDEETSNPLGVLTGKSGKGAWTKGQADGTFTLQSVPLGVVAVEAKAEGFAPSKSESMSILSGEKIEQIEVVVRTGSNLRGKVLLSSGAPLVGATVRVSPAHGNEDAKRMRAMMGSFLGGGQGGTQTFSDNQGEYEFEHMATGRYDVSATHPRYAPSATASVFVDGPMASAPDLTLDEGGSITGLVKAGKEPRSGIMIQLFGPSPMQMSTTNEEGTFFFERLATGDYTMNLMDTQAMRVGSGMTLRHEEVTIIGNEHVTIEIEFLSGHTVSGKVEGMKEGETIVLTLRRPGGPAPEDFEATDIDAAMEANKYQVGVAFVGEDAKFIIKGVEPGPYFLEAPHMPGDMTDVEAYAKMDRTPRFRQEITVEEKDLEVTVKLR